MSDAHVKEEMSKIFEEARLEAEEKINANPAFKVLLAVQKLSRASSNNEYFSNTARGFLAWVRKTSKNSDLSDERLLAAFENPEWPSANKDFKKYLSEYKPSFLLSCDWRWQAAALNGGNIWAVLRDVQEESSIFSCVEFEVTGSIVRVKIYPIGFVRAEAEGLTPEVVVEIDPENINGDLLAQEIQKWLGRNQAFKELGCMRPASAAPPYPHECSGLR